ncbi:hypothetical protein [Kineococcus terrestris]|uniref:hypothetical protein n=1 Tax=Kineococcus terrestris TaxID=2044856 RepID=UPI0034DB0661
MGSQLAVLVRSRRQRAEDVRSAARLVIADLYAFQNQITADVLGRGPFSGGQGEVMPRLSSAADERRLSDNLHGEPWLKVMGSLTRMHGYQRLSPRDRVAYHRKDPANVLEMYQYVEEVRRTLTSTARHRHRAHAHMDGVVVALNALAAERASGGEEPRVG